VSIPKQIWAAPRPLTLLEFEVVKTHTLNSYEILNDFHEQVRHGARSHHEKFNGTGYPDGIPGVKTPLFGRITAISDIYDAMTSRRSYKEPQSPFSVFSMLNRLKKTELDPMLVDVFLEYMPRELVEKPVMLSDGSIGLVKGIDPEDYEFPYVFANGRTVKCGKELYCRYMYHD
jgi:HD-GYP domain-containing protein (c-di-GMP phosphodiesterase class II)